MRYFLFVSAAALFLFQSCVPQKERITGSGIYLFSINDPFSTAIANDLPGIRDRDTSFTEGEFSWRGLILQYPDGMVLIEEDFFGYEVIGRVRVETAQLQLKNGLKVGDTLRSLKKADKKWTITAMPGFGRFDFFSEKFPGIHFIVKAPGIALDADKLYLIGDFNEISTVESIVVF